MNEDLIDAGFCPLLFNGSIDYNNCVKEENKKWNIKKKLFFNFTFN